VQRIIDTEFHTLNGKLCIFLRGVHTKKQTLSRPGSLLIKNNSTVGRFILHHFL
jgi:hypothetical protein